MAVEIKIDLLKYKSVQVDSTAAPTIYYGVTENSTAGNADEEWGILRESVVGAVTTYSWAKHGYGLPDQVFAWDDRATLSY